MGRFASLSLLLLVLQIFVVGGLSKVCPLFSCFRLITRYLLTPDQLRPRMFLKMLMKM
jgi:hypothetical protein